MAASDAEHRRTISGLGGASRAAKRTPAERSAEMAAVARARWAKDRPVDATADALAIAARWVPYEDRRERLIAEHPDYTPDELLRQARIEARLDEKRLRMTVENGDADA